MILPEKHIPIHASLFGFGAYLLGYIREATVCRRSMGHL